MLTANYDAAGQRATTSEERFFERSRRSAPMGPTFFRNTAELRNLWRNATTWARALEDVGRAGLDWNDVPNNRAFDYLRLSKDFDYGLGGTMFKTGVAPPINWFEENTFPKYVKTRRAKRRPATAGPRESPSAAARPSTAGPREPSTVDRFRSRESSAAARRSLRHRSRTSRPRFHETWTTSRTTSGTRASRG